MTTVITKKYVLVFFAIVILSASLLAYAEPVDTTKGWHPLQQVTTNATGGKSVDTNDNNAVDNADLSSESNTLGGLISSNFCRKNKDYECYIGNLIVGNDMSSGSFLMELYKAGEDVSLALNSGGGSGNLWVINSTKTGELKYRIIGGSSPGDKVTFTSTGDINALGTLSGGAGIFAGELFLGGARTNLVGFDGANIHWIRTNGNDSKVWLGFQQDATGQPLSIQTPGNELVIRRDTGKVGIGTASQSDMEGKLTVKTSADSYGLFHTDGNVKIGTYVGSGGGWLGTQSNHPLYFFTNDSGSQITLKQDGKVGIGTSTPGEKLYVSGNINATGNVRGAKLCIGNDCRPSWPTGMGGNGTANYISKWNGSASLGNSVIYDDGSSVGIGTATPQAKLEVNLYNPLGWDGNTKGFRLTSPDTNYYLDINPYVIASGNVGYNFSSVSPKGTAAGLVISSADGIIEATYGATWISASPTAIWYGIAISSEGRYQTAINREGNIFISADYGNDWTQKLAAGFPLEDVAISSDGKYQTALESRTSWPYNGRIFVSSDFGQSWVARGPGVSDPKYSWGYIAMSSDGKYQTAIGYYYDGVAFDGKIYISSDYGMNWAQSSGPTGTLTGIFMSSDGKYQTLIGRCYGTHSSCTYAGEFYTSDNYGQSWTKRDVLGPLLYWMDVAISSDGRYQTAVLDNGEIYISSDYGVNWAAKGTVKYWKDVAMSSDGKYQTAIASSPGKIYTSYDYGNIWIESASLTEIWPEQIAMSSDGKYQTVITGDGPANGRIYVSPNYGVSWTVRGLSKMWKGIVMTTDGSYQTAIVNNDYIYTSHADFHSNIGIGTNNPETIFDVNGNSIRIRTTKTPSSTTDPTGKTGDISWDNNYIYVKTNAGWKRSALSTWP
ncbi:MAG: hypothetical protein V1802_00915 [Candidatus Aenigmatarchaeota archaeon]